MCCGSLTTEVSGGSAHPSAASLLQSCRRRRQCSTEAEGNVGELCLQGKQFVNLCVRPTFLQREDRRFFCVCVHDYFIVHLFFGLCELLVSTRRRQHTALRLCKKTKSTSFLRVSVFHSLLFMFTNHSFMLQ